MSIPLELTFAGMAFPGLSFADMPFADPAWFAVAILLSLLVLVPWALFETDRLRERLWQRHQLRAVMLKSRRR